jgi:hypothetical protein
MKKIRGLYYDMACLVFLFSTAVHAQITITLDSTLPYIVDNSAKQFFRAMFDQGQCECCGNANAIGYTFTYEMDCARNLSAADTADQYPYLFTYHFLNGGSADSGTSHMYVDAFKIARENGIPNVTDFGGFTTSQVNGYPTKWMSGYDYYYRAMQNRVDKIDTLDMTQAGAIVKLKQWLYNHGNGSANGGIANFGCSALSWHFTTIASGQEAGKSICTGYGTLASGDHAQTIIGYNDSIHYDFNGDGKFTNTVDLDSNGSVDMADWETGAVKVTNTWGGGVDDIGDNGIYWLPYRFLAMPESKGGLRNGNYVCIISVKRTYSPKLALKASITDAIRNNIALSVGVSTDQSATAPSKVRKFERQFTYAGGAYPMCGKSASSSIEIGLDITDLLDSVPGSATAKFFLIVESKGGSGTADSLSLMDYTSGSLKQTKSSQTAVGITAGTLSLPIKTYIGVSTTISSTRPINISAAVKNDLIVKYINGFVRVCFTGTGMHHIDIFDLSGRKRASFSGEAQEWILPENILPGVYFIDAFAGNGKRIIREVNINR